jgi:hypothetical protein
MITTILNLMFEKEISGLPRPVVDPLSESDSLQEALLLDIFHNVTSSATALLFDLRTSLYFEKENTGILVLRKVSNIVFTTVNVPHPHVWSVSGSKIRIKNNSIHVRLTDMSGGMLDIEAESVEFFSGIVNSIGDVAAEIEDQNLDAFLKTVPNWGSKIEVIGFSMKRIS